MVNRGADDPTRDASCPRVSIAMATRNGGLYLEAQLASLVRQTLRPHELVVCDDGSQDSTQEIVKQFARRAPFPVRLHMNERRLGFADNFLTAASLCQGTLIAFCDQDNVWVDHKLVRCVASFADPAVQLVMHAGRVVDGQLRPLGHRFPRIPRSRVVASLGVRAGFGLAGFAMVFRSSLLSIDWRTRPLSSCNWERNDPMPHDEWVCFIASALGHVALLADELCDFRQHGANACGFTSLDPKASLKLALETGAESYQRQADRASCCADFLRVHAGREGSPWRDHLARGADHYRRLAERLAQRARLYQPHGNPWRKLGILTRLLWHRGYRPHDQGGLGLKSLLKDGARVMMG